MHRSYSAKGERAMTWYIIFKVWELNSVLQFDELDAVECECSMDAITYAKRRHRTARGETLRAEACLTMEHINRAKSIAKQHQLDDQVNNWTEADWNEFVRVQDFDAARCRHRVSGMV